MRLAQFAQTLVGERGDLGPEPPELILVGAELLGAVPTVEIAVGRLGKALGVLVEGDLPAGQQGHRQHQQAPGVGLAHEEQRREHHGVVPVVDPAGAAALVLQKPALEGTEEQDADHVTDRVGQAQENHNAVIQKTGHVQRAEETVKGDPDQSHQHNRVVVLNVDGGLAGLDVVSGKLLLTSRTLQTGGEEAQNHFHHEDSPDEAEDHGTALQHGGDLRTAFQTEGEIHPQKSEKQRGAVDQPKIVKTAYDGQLWFMGSFLQAIIPSETYARAVRLRRQRRFRQPGLPAES